MNLERLTRGHVAAALAALALLVVMAMNWYGTTRADQARQISSQVNPNGAESGQIGRETQQAAAQIIAHDEKNAWHETAAIDRVLLALLLLTVVFAIAGAGLRAQGRRFEPPLTPSALAALSAVAAALLVAYRVINQPGSNSTTTLKIGPFLALVALAAVGIGSAAAFQKEADYAETRRAAMRPREPFDAGPDES